MRITVLVGTDHHDFSRLVGWADGWQRNHPADVVLVQHGFSPAPSVARGTELVPPTELVGLLRDSDVVITHGGPGTIMSARHAGHHPVAVPRDPAVGEHVDEHQMRFVTWASVKGLCQEAVTVEQLSQAVSALGPEGTRVEHQVAVAPAVDPGMLDEAARSRRRRRAPAPGAVPVLYSPGTASAPPAPPQHLASARLVLLGQVSLLWLGGPRAACSCGSGRADCPFWTEVTRRAFGDEEAAALGRAAEAHRGLAHRRVAAARRHPGPEARRAFLQVALVHLGTCTAAMAVAGADGVVDHGGPLSDALPLSHCRELDLRVLHKGTADRVTAAALRYRGVPTWRPADGRVPADLVSEHQLAPADAGALHGSIAW